MFDAAGTRMTKAEQETIVRWDQEERVLDLWTAYPAQARTWTRLGYPVEVHSRVMSGEPRSWRARVPVDALRWRRVHDGRIVTRSRGRRKVVEDRKFMASEQRSHRGLGSRQANAANES